MNSHLWLGSQESFDALQANNARKLADPKFSAAADFSTEVMNQIYSVQKNVGVISIKGSLVEGSAGYGVFFGQTGYDDIRNALVAAVSNPDVQSILLDISSGGGHVAGVDDTAQLISRVNTVKPVVTYTGSMMGSAALWLGSSASHTVAGKTAIVGSLGVIMVHMDRSRQMEADGVKPTIIRAGSEKALASPYEPLSEKAQAGLQSQADVLYGVFLNHVASSRGVSASNGDKKFGQGREFVGQQAVDAGLVDKLGTYEDAFLKAQAACKPKKKSGMKAEMPTLLAVCPTEQANAGDNPANTEGTSMPKPLTEEALAAMAAGVDLETETEADPAVALQAQLDATRLELADVTASMAALTLTIESERADMQSKLSAFVEIARNSVKTMGVHLGVKADAVAGMDSDTVLAEHTRLAALFKAKFKVGGVAATTPEVVVAPKVQASPMFAAFLQSTAK